MNRDILKKLTIEFKKSLGYIEREDIDHPNCILFSRGEIQELVYIHEPGEESNLTSVLSKLSQKYKRIPAETGRIFLTTSPIGRPPECIQENGFKYQVPVWFFDREFSTLKESTPLKKLEAQITKYESERIPQPFSCNNKRQESDLLDVLLQELESPQQAWLRIIVAQAGYGKTVLMTSLYSKLKKEFDDEKKRQRLSMRPLIMLPGHIGGASQLDDLIRNFINAEYTFGEASINTFKFWINNNFAVWLLDGVEELFIENPEECMYSLLDEYILAPGHGKPQIIMAIRKQLLAVSPEFKRYIEEWGDCIKVYELKEWDNKSKKMYFERNLTISSEEKNNFIKDIENSPVLTKLCEVPYFCNIICDLKNQNQLGTFNDDEELITHAFEKFCDREFDKGLDREIFPVSTQRDILMELSEELLKGNEIRRELIKGWIEIYTEHCSEEVKEEQTNTFLRHALLNQIEEKIDFTHEIMKEYLQAQVLREKLQQNYLEIFDKVEIEHDSFLLKCLVKYINSLNINWQEIINKAAQTPCSPKDEAICFRNILKIFVKSNYSNIEQVIKDFLSCKNLRSLQFCNLNFSRFNFQNSNLESVTFEDCNLENANLDGCTFKNTYFNRCTLTGATTKGSCLISINIDGKTITDIKEIRKVLYNLTNVPIPQQGPCQALVNLLEILKRIVRKPKAYKMPKKFLLAAKLPRVPADKLVNELIKEKILREEGEYVKINVELYDKIKLFVDNPEPQKIEEIDDILDRICPDKSLGCRHFPIRD
ncbi:MAG: pentapeptide repeat-containing protein [Candidatus Micrarchaeia archaeon]